MGSAHGCRFYRRSDARDPGRGQEREGRIELRRGHAKDLQLGSANLHEILTAWDGRSPALFRYLDMFELEAGAMMEAHCDESSSEDES